MDLDVTKVAHRLILRLFNHRQFTSGEIDYLVKELCIPAEENFARVLTTNQNVCLISDRNTENCLEVTKDVLTRVNMLQEKADKLLKLEDHWRQKEEDLLKDLRAKLEKSTRDYSDNITGRIKRLKESLFNEELELERSYLAFEKKHMQQQHS